MDVVKLSCLDNKIGLIFVFVDVVSTSLKALVDKFGSGLSVDVAEMGCHQYCCAGLPATTMTLCSLSIR